jgi:tRNA(fMet)-specific endonuclease VapC
VITHLLDTNVAISLLAGKSDSLLKRVLAHSPGSLAFSAVVVHELYYGAHKSQRIDHNLEAVRLFLRNFPILELDQKDAIAAGEIRATLARKGKPVGPLDLLLAGQAKARDLTMVTNNTREFERVPGLRVEDWLR